MRKDHKILRYANGKEIKHKELDSSPHVLGERTQSGGPPWAGTVVLTLPTLSLGVSLSLSEPPLMGEVG